jgi:hypothetical protein
VRSGYTVLREHDQVATDCWRLGCDIAAPDGRAAGWIVDQRRKPSSPPRFSAYHVGGSRLGDYACFEHAFDAIANADLQLRGAFNV